jgi:SAM-dependent methyltransferase
MAAVRRFTSEYLAATRDGMWADSRGALAGLDLQTRREVIDVGAGSGEFTAVLRSECNGRVVAVDADPDLLAHVGPPRLLGDALRLPIRDGSSDLVVCQALLVNLPDPVDAIAEFARVSSDLVAAVEPDNGAVTVESTVDAESALARRARERYLEGVGTDVALGDASAVFEAAGLESISVRRYDHVRTVEAPYSDRDVEAARRKATGQALADDRATMLAGSTSPGEFDDLRQDWRTMGRAVVTQMQAGEYRREERIPFYVTVGRVA